MNYTIKVTYTHWIDVEAENEDEAFNEAIELQQTFVSDLEDMEMEIV